VREGDLKAIGIGHLPLLIGAIVEAEDLLIGVTEQVKRLNRNIRSSPPDPIPTLWVLSSSITMPLSSTENSDLHPRLVLSQKDVRRVCDHRCLCRPRGRRERQEIIHGRTSRTGV
jgi:hypothetical protein